MPRISVKSVDTEREGGDLNPLASQVSNTVQEIEVSHIDVELVQAQLKLAKRSADEFKQHTFNYRLSDYDIAFAQSITDEIIQLEPLEDKLYVLKQKYDMAPLDIIRLVLSRISFFALFNLFETVELNQIDNQSNMQKIWLHLKNQET